MHDWPSYALVGRERAQAAWLLIPHSPSDLQDRVLPLIRSAVSSGDADPMHLAYLEYRVDVHHDRPQRYGTQLREVDGRLAAFPLAESNTFYGYS